MRRVVFQCNSVYYIPRYNSHPREETRHDRHLRFILHQEEQQNTHSGQ